MPTIPYDTHNWGRNPNIALDCAYISGDVYLPDSAPKHPFISGWERVYHPESNGATLYATQKHLFTPKAMHSDLTDTSLLRYFYARLYKSPIDEYIIAYRGTDNIANVPADLKIGIPGLNARWSAYDEAAIAFHDFIMSKLNWHAPIWITGHSLGGYLAQVVAARNPFNTVAIAFNAPSIGGLEFPTGKSSFFNSTYLTVPDRDPNIFLINSSAQDPVHYAGGYSVGQVYNFPGSSCQYSYISPHFFDHGLCEHALQTVLAQVSKYRDLEETVSQQADDMYQKELAAMNT